MSDFVRIVALAGSQDGSFAKPGALLAIEIPVFDVRVARRDERITNGTRIYLIERLSQQLGRYWINRAAASWQQASVREGRASEAVGVAERESNLCSLFA